MENYCKKYEKKKKDFEELEEKYSSLSKFFYLLLVLIIDESLKKIKNENLVRKLKKSRKLENFYLTQNGKTQSWEFGTCG